MARRSKPKTRHYRCSKCGAPVPVGYTICGLCGQDQAEQPLLMRVDTLEVLTREYNRWRYGH